MPDDRGKLKKLHENLVRDGYALPDYVTFERDMSDSNSLKKLHGTLLKDGYELPDEVTFRTDMGYGEVKKKVTLGGGGTLAKNGSPATNGRLNGSGGFVGEIAEISEKEQLANYIVGLKTPEQKSYSAQPKPITATTTLKKDERPFDQTKEEYVTGATQKLNDIMYGDGDAWKDPIKSSINGVGKSSSTKEALDFYGAKNLTEESLMPNGFDAKRILSSTHFGSEGDNNLTAKALRSKVIDYEKTVSPFRGIEPSYLAKDQVYDAAIIAYANKNDQFKKQLEAAGIDLNKPDIRLSLGDNDSKVGNIMSQVLNNPDLVTFLQNENPDLIPVIQDVQENLIYDNKDFGKVQLANEISRDMQKEGYNKIDPIFNLENNAKEMGDVTAETLYLNDPKKLQFYRENKEDILSKLDAPSLFTGFAEAGKGFGKGILNTFTEPFTSVSKTVKEGWEKEASHVSADPKGLVRFLSDSGHALGFVASIGATGNVFGAAGLSQSAASMTALGVGFLGDNLEQAKMKYPDSPVKQWTSGLFNTGLYMAMGKSLFPAAKVEQAIAKVQPGVSKVIENLASGKVTREAARLELNTFGKQAMEIAGVGLQKNIKVSAEMTGITILNKALDRVLGMEGETFKEYHPEGEEADTFKSMFLSNIIVNGLAARGQVRSKNTEAKNSIYEAASNPNRYRNIIESSEIRYDVKNAKELLDNLDYVSNLKKELDGIDLTEKQKKDYLFNALASKAANESKPASPDATLTRQHSERVRELEEINEGILEGKDADEIVTKKEQKEIDEKENTEIELERLAKQNELDNKEFTEKRKELDGRTPDDRIKIEKLEQGIKEKNEDYEKRVSKLKPPEPKEEKAEETPVSSVGGDKVADIEKRRQEEKDKYDVGKGGVLPIEGYEKTFKDIDEKYDAELAQAEQPSSVEGGDVAFKDDALQNVLNGGTNYTLDELRYPGKKKRASRKDETKKDHYNAVQHALYNKLIDEKNINAKTSTYGLAILGKHPRHAKEMIEDGVFQDDIKKGYATPNQVKNIIEGYGLEVPKDILEQSLPKGEAADQPTSQQTVNEVKEQATEAVDQKVKKLTEERDSKIKEAMRPEVELVDIGEKDYEKASATVEAQQSAKRDEIMGKDGMLDNLRKIIDCIYGKKG